MKKDIIIILGLLFLLLIFFWKAATLQGMFFCDSGGSDITDFFYPMRTFAAESFKEGKVPLWSSYIYCGFPVFAEGQAGTIYPFNMILNWLLPAYASFNYCIIYSATIN